MYDTCIYTQVLHRSNVVQLPTQNMFTRVHLIACGFLATHSLDLMMAHGASRVPGARNGLLWLYGVVFFSQFKPSEPFLVDFLVDEKGFTNHEAFF